MNFPECFQIGMRRPEMFASLWFVVNITCVLAALTQLFFIMMGFINPNQLNTDTSELALQDIDFPLDIKICAEPAFDENAIAQAGYGNQWGQYEYFTGRSRFNSSIYGWGGHTDDAGMVGSVEEVLDKVRNHKVDDIVKFIQFDFTSIDNEKSVNVSAHLTKVNYPQNCYSVNLTQISKASPAEGVKMLKMAFKTEKTKSVSITLQCRTLTSNREMYDNAFYTKGDPIYVEPGKFRKYAVEISKNVYLEEDKSKNCRDYPNQDFASYMDCDEQHMKNICKSMNLAPIWLYDDLNEVTTMNILNHSGILAKQTNLHRLNHAICLLLEEGAKL